MNLQETISKDIIDAMKSKQKERLDVLRFIKSLFIQNNTAVKPTDDLSVVVGHAKKLQDSLSMYTAGTEAYQKIESEIKIIKEYLPKPLEQSEVENIIHEIKKNNPGANMGLIMKELGVHIKGRFDGKLASDLVKKIIG